MSATRSLYRPGTHSPGRRMRGVSLLEMLLVVGLIAAASLLAAAAFTGGACISGALINSRCGGGVAPRAPSAARALSLRSLPSPCRAGLRQSRGARDFLAGRSATNSV